MTLPSQKSLFSGKMIPDAALYLTAHSKLHLEECFHSIYSFQETLQSAHPIFFFLFLKTNQTRVVSESMLCFSSKKTKYTRCYATYHRMINPLMINSVNCCCLLPLVTQKPLNWWSENTVLRVSHNKCKLWTDFPLVCTNICMNKDWKHTYKKKKRIPVTSKGDLLALQGTRTLPDRHLKRTKCSLSLMQLQKNSVCHSYSHQS